MEFKFKKNLVIFSDLDGTALLDNHQFSDSLIQTVKELYDKNIWFIPVTARITKDAIWQQAKLLNIDKYKGIAVANNGSQVYDFKSDKFIINKFISKDILRQIFEKTFGKVGEYKVHYFAGDTCYVYGYGENSNYWANVMKVNYVIIDNFEQIEKPVSHMTFVLNEEFSLQNKEKFLQDFDFLREQIDIIKYTNRVYELSTKGINKGSIVKEVLTYLKLDKEETTTFAFGDGYNDIPLLKAVDYPIALENSIQELKDIAVYVTKSNNDDGVSFFIKNKILKEI
ncbi:HAD-IIB family hydrolase [Spiroplasma turonicum]|uniref:HAD superfamily hydrolase n=1 Tax=Spiroplasma turonicum TaxID=216946 RepID=A0A0K1P4Y3_9MOLU|nr:HAD-IIB family hydrolase [Spiroplasma turonicum]AKU79366.1 HAD superfamily hydrolase [Spiroplasma turonicum]ALX70387.1 HAD superfamily hydrolase [Spiroplasma turonicum]